MRYKYGFSKLEKYRIEKYRGWIEKCKYDSSLQIRWFRNYKSPHPMLVKLEENKRFIIQIVEEMPPWN